MKGAAIDGFGPPSVLGLHQLPIPEPGPDEILIALTAAGVGVWDAEVRDGSWQPAGKPQFPFVLGTDGAGMVAAKGARVRRFNVGERVWAYSYANPKGGFYAEYVAVKARDAARVPKHLDLLQAGAAPTTGLTALQGIEDQLRLRSGDTLLVYGASGAVGTLAVQFAKRCGARVIGTATGRSAMGPVRKLGADEVFDARSAKASEHLGELASRASTQRSCSLPVSRSENTWLWCENAAALLSPTAWSRNQNVGPVSACRHMMPWLGPASLNIWNAPRPKSGFACQLPESFRWRRRRRRTRGWNADMS